MMCGSTERPETLDAQEFRFRRPYSRGERVRWTEDSTDLLEGGSPTDVRLTDVRKGTEGVVDEPKGGRASIAPWVKLDDGRRVVADAKTLEPAEAPAFEKGQTVRVTGNGSTTPETGPRHYLTVGAEVTVVDPKVTGYYSFGDLVRVHGAINGRSEGTQVVSPKHLEPVVDEVPSLTVGQKVRITGQGRPSVMHALPVGSEGVVSGAPYVEAPYGLIAQVDGTYKHGRALTQYVGVMHLEPVVEEATPEEWQPRTPEPLPAALAHIPPTPRPTLESLGRAIDPSVFDGLASARVEDFTPSREETVEVFGEPETEEVPISRPNELREGDVVVSAPSDRSRGYAPVVVRREVLAAPEPAKPARGTFGTAVVDGERLHGMIDEDGDFAYKTWDGLGSGDTYTSEFEDFQSYADAPALPDRAELAQALAASNADRANAEAWLDEADFILAELARRG